jgi:hypothetical protein
MRFVLRGLDHKSLNKLHHINRQNMIWQSLYKVAKAILYKAALPR